MMYFGLGFGEIKSNLVLDLSASARARAPRVIVNNFIEKTSVCHSYFVDLSLKTMLYL